MIKTTAQASNNNVAKNSNKISVSKYKGTLTGTVVIAPPILCEPSLDFSCNDNSSYTAVI